LVAKPLFDEPNIAPGSHWAKARKLAATDLIDEPSVLAQSASLARSLHHKRLRNNGFEPALGKGADDVAPSLHVFCGETSRPKGLLGSARSDQLVLSRKPDHGITRPRTFPFRA
jgi:hypothetical protein